MFGKRKNYNNLILLVVFIISASQMSVLPSSASIIPGNVSIDSISTSYSPSGTILDTSSVILYGYFTATIMNGILPCNSPGGSTTLMISKNGNLASQYSVSVTPSFQAGQISYQFSFSLGQLGAGNSILFYFQATVNTGGLGCASTSRTSPSQSFTVYPSSGPIVTNVHATPSNPDSTDSVSVSATILDQSTISYARLYYGTDDSNTYDYAVMTNSGNTYTGIIPARNFANMKYYISVTDATTTIKNQIVNSGFESGTLSPWTTDYAHAAKSSTYYGYGGSSWGVELDHYCSSCFPNYSPAYISQSVTMPVFEFQSLTFHYIDNDVKVTISYTDGSSSYVHTFPGALSWSSGTVSYSDLNPSKTISSIRFDSTANGGSYTAIDAISLNSLSSSTYVISSPNGPFISQVSFTPSNPTSTQQVSVNAVISDISGLSSETLYYSTDSGSTYTAVSMTAGSGGNLYTATIPPLNDGTNVIFYIQATDTSGRSSFTELQNSGFESGTISPWIADYAHAAQSTTYYGYGGSSWGVELDHYTVSQGYSPAYIEQRINMPVSQFQGLSFYYIDNPVNVTIGYSDNTLFEKAFPTPSPQLSWKLATLAQSELNINKNILFIRIHSLAYGGTYTAIDDVILNPQHPYSYTVYTPDTTPPVIGTPVQNITNPDYTQAVMINSTITDAGTGVQSAVLYYSINNGNSWIQQTMTNSGSNYYTIIGKQPYNTKVLYYITATDKASNVQTSSTYNYNVIDDIAPNISSFSFSPTSPGNNQPVTVTVVATDSASQVKNATLEYSINSTSSYVSVLMNPQSGNAYTGTIPGQPIGSSVSFFVKVFDNSFNVNQTSSKQYSVIDNTPPTITINGIIPINPQSYNFVNVTATIIDTGSGVQSAILMYSLDLNSWINITMTNDGSNIYNATIPAQPYGTTVYYKIQAKDGVGNLQVSLQQSYIVEDIIPPSITNIVFSPSLPGPLDNVLVTASITDQGSGLHNETLYYNLNGNATWFTLPMTLQSGSTFSATIPNQVYNTRVIFYITAFDNQNNNKTSSNYFYIVGDITPPEINNIVHPASPDAGSLLVISASVSDTGSGIKNVTLVYQINSGSWITTSMILNSGTSYIGDIPAQAYLSYVNFYIIAFDNAENRNQSSTTTFQVGDYSAPSISSITLNPNNPQINELVAVNATVTDSGSGIKTVVLRYSFDSGSTWTTVTMTPLTGSIYNATIPPTSSTYTVEYYVSATDNVGNSQQSQTYTISFVDTIPPVISNTQYSPDPVQANEQITVFSQVTDSGSGVKTVYLYYSTDNGLTWKNLTMGYYLGTYNGSIPGQAYQSTVKFYIKAIDVAGNQVQTQPITFTVVDTISPYISYLSKYPIIPSYASSTKVSFAVSDSGSGLATVQLYYSIDNGITFSVVNLVHISSTVYNGTIPVFPTGTTVQFYAYASDNAGNTALTPTFSYTVVDSIKPVISTISYTPLAPTDTESVVINTTVSDVGSGVYNVTLFYGLYGSSTWTAVLMSNTNNNFYNYTIPAQVNGTTIQYYIQAIDNVGNIAKSSTFTYTSGDTTPPVISGVTNYTTISYDSTPNILAYITDIGSGIQNVTIYFKLSTSSTWSQASMHIYSSTQYLGSIPAYSYGSTVEYYVVAFDNAGNQQNSSIYSYAVIDAVPPSIGTVLRSPIGVQATDLVTISVSVSDAGSGVNQVLTYYSTDNGATWTSITMVNDGTGTYTSTIPAQPYLSVVLYYVKATDNAGNVAGSGTNSYTVGDNTPPTISNILISPVQPQPYDVVTITASISDAGSGVKSSTFYYSLDSGLTWITSPFSGSATIPGFAINTFVEYKIGAVDYAGNAINTSVSSYTVLDTVPPVITNIKQNPISPTYNTTVTISASVTDKSSGVKSVSLQYSIDSGSNWITLQMSNQSNVYSAIIPVQKYGITVEYKIVATDISGNTIQSTASSYAISDPYLPIMTNFAQSPSNPEYNESVVVSSIATDNGSGINYVQVKYSIDNGNTFILISATNMGNNLYEAVIPATSYNTTVQYEFIAVDNAQNTLQSSIFTYTTIDTYNPILENLIQKPPNPNYQEAVNITITAVDSGSGINSSVIYYSINQGLSWNQITMNSLGGNAYTQNVPAQTSGTNVEYFISLTDNAGNNVNGSVYNYNVIDNVAPVIVVNSQTITEELGSSGNTIIWTVNDVSPQNYTLYKDNVVVETGNFNSGTVITTNIDGLALGTYNYTLLVFDSSNNKASLSVQVTVQDTTPPVFTNSPVSFTYELGSTGNSLSWTATDLQSGSYILYRNSQVINTGTWVSGTALSFNVDTLAVGTYNYTIVVSDLSGNSVSNQVTVTVQDTTAPVFTNAPSDFTYELGSTGNSISWTATDLAPNSYTLYQNGTLVNSGTWFSGNQLTFSVDGLKVSTFNYTLVVADASGNTATKSVFVTVRDTTAPIFTNVPSDFTYELGSTGNSISWTATDLAPNSYTLYQNGTLVNSGTWFSGNQLTFSVDGLSVNVYNYTLVVEDASGNTATKSVFVTVRDTTAPIFTNVPSDFTYELGSTGNSISWTATDLAPNSYTLYQNGTLVSSGPWSSGNQLTFSVDALSVGTYNFTLTVEDESGNSVTSTVFVTVRDTTSPVFINTPSDLLYELGSSGHTLVWNATDLQSGSYTIYKNSVAVDSGSWTSGTPVSIIVDGLNVGTYNYTIAITDASGNTAANQDTVTVEDTTAPVFTAIPNNLSYIVGTTGNNLSWTATDLSANSYTVYENGTVFTTGNWQSGNPILISVDALAVSTYNFTMVVADSYGNSVISVVWVTVIASPPGHQSLIKFDHLGTTPNNPYAGENVEVYANISSTLPLNQVILHYKVGNGGYNDISMTATNFGSWTAIIGPFNEKDKVTFYITATDTSGNSQDSHTSSFTVSKPPKGISGTNGTNATNSPKAQGFEFVPLIFSLAVVSIIIIHKKRT